MIEKPEKSSGDNIHLASRAAISSIPFVGGAASELFNAVIIPPLEKRKEKWIIEVTDAINELLKSKNINYKQLRENEQFISTIQQASLIAIKNHQNEKLESLKNAVLNSTLPSSPDEALQQIFLSFIDTFSVWHIKFLKLFENPIKWFQLNGKQFPNLMAGGLSYILESAFPELKGKQSFYDLVWTELYSRGLTNTSGLHTTMSASGLQSKRVSELGDEFIKYISSPL